MAVGVPHPEYFHQHSKFRTTRLSDLHIELLLFLRSNDSEFLLSAAVAPALFQNWQLHGYTKEGTSLARREKFCLLWSPNCNHFPVAMEKLTAPHEHLGLASFLGINLHLIFYEQMCGYVPIFSSSKNKSFINSSKSVPVIGR